MLPNTLLRAAADTLMAGLLCISAAHAQETVNICGSLDNLYGPFDYRTDRKALPVVESHHFTASIERLVRDHNGSNVPGHLSYTLNAFPNHHRALMSIVRYGEKMKSRTPPDLDHSIDCYFERAMRFRPDDHIVRVLFASYLGKTDRVKEAVEQLTYAKSQVKDNPLAEYNIGLVYFDLGRYDEALAQAHLTAQMGVPRTDLRDKLKAKGRWTEPPALAPAEGAASTAKP